MRFLLILPLAALVFALLVWPMAILAWRSAGAEGAGWFANYLAVIESPAYRGALVNSIVLSFSVACASVALCLAPAWLLVRRQFRGKRLLRALYVLPMSFSGVIVGFLAIIMIGRIGVVPQAAEALAGYPLLSGAAYQFTGLLIAYVYFEIPRATLTLESSLRKFDFQLEAAAKSLGANRWQRLFLVILPNLGPAILSTLAVTFSVSLGSFGVALILARRFSVLPVEIFEQYTGFLNPGLASAMAIALAATAFTVNYSARRLLDGRRA